MSLVLLFQESVADVTAPTLSSATLAANGTSLTLAFNENVNVGAGGNGGFTVSFSGGAATVSYASGDGTPSLVYTVSRTIEAGETGTVSYTQPGNGIEDDAGIDLASFSNSTVTNNSTQDTTVPTLSSATVTGDGATLTMVFSETVNVGAGGNGGFVATMSGGASALTYSSGDTTNTLIYTFARTIAEGETGTLAYTQPGNGIEDDAGNDLATFSGSTVVNVSPGVIQSRQQASIRADSGSTQSYNGDFISLMKSDLGVSTGSFNELLILWLQDKLSSSETNLQSLKAEAAADRSVSSFQFIADPTDIGT